MYYVTLLLRSVFISNYSNSVHGFSFLNQYRKVIKTLERLTGEIKNWRFLFSCSVFDGLLSAAAASYDNSIYARR